MIHLDISLLGTLQVARDGQPISEPAYAKVLGLLAFLAVESDRPHQRATLAGLLWPDQPEERARHSLRQALTTLRRVVGQNESSQILLTSRDTLAFNKDAGHTVDVHELESLLAERERHDHCDAMTCPPCTRRLERATELYRGDFLEGFSLADSEAFEDWTMIWRQRLQDRVLLALDDLVTSLDQQGNSDGAVRACRRQLDIDPCRESSHRRLMTLLWRSRNRTAALAQYARCQQILDEELGVEPEAETIELYHQIRDGMFQPASVSPSPSKPPTHVRVPAPTTHLVGRKQELEEIADLLFQRDCRLLTLLGPGGSGKTRLAVHITTERARRSTGITCFVPLDSVRNADGMAHAIASALGLSLHGREPPDRQILSWLREREVFLVLDSVEHLTDGIDLVPTMLATAPELTILVTSRERLNVAGEWIYHLSGLAFPSSEASDAFEGYDAVELFSDRLRQVRSGVPLRHEERPDVIRICQLVGGMPLALELAAAWANTLTLRQIAEGIRDNLDFLSHANRDQPDRHQSMRAVFNSSWSMLTVDEQTAYRRLSVFNDGFLLEAAQNVADTRLQSLAALINKSLLTRLPSGRYRLHGLLVQFGEELLRRDPEEFHERHTRHSLYYLDWLSRQEHLLTGLDQDAALKAIEADMGNISSSWAWATEHGMVRNLVAAAPAYWLFFVIRGRMRDGAETFGSMLTMLDRAVSANGVGNQELLIARAMAQVYTGGFRSGMGRYGEAITLLEEGSAFLSNATTGRAVGLSLNMLAAALSMEGRFDEARDRLFESLGEFERVHDVWGMAFSLNDLGMISHLNPGYDEAQSYCERSRMLFRQVGDKRGMALASHNLGVIAMNRGEFRRAMRLHQETLALREESEDRYGVTASLVQIGIVSRLMNRETAAREHLVKALDVAWQSAIVPGLLHALVELATLDGQDDDRDHAETLFTAIFCHPALHVEVQNQVEEQMRSLGLDPSDSLCSPDMDSWAVRTVENAARSLVGSTSD